MIVGSRLRIQAKCVNCQTTWMMTEEQQQRSRELGGVLSPCCNFVATVMSIKTNRFKTRGRRAWK